MSQSIDQRVKELRNYIIKKKGEEEAISNQIKLKNTKKKEIEEDNQENLIMKTLLNRSSSEAKENGRQMLSNIATSSVQTVFSDGSSVDIKIDSRGGARAVVIKEKDGVTKEIDPSNGDSGGQSDIISLALFMAIRETSAKFNNAPYILDEPSKYVSDGIFTEQFSSFVSNMADYTGRQMFISTHDDYLKNIGDKTYTLKLNQLTKETEAKEI